MTSVKRLTSRVAALASAPLAPEMLVPELLIALQNTIGTDALLPAVLVHDAKMGPLQEFVVWRGSEFTDAVRGLLSAGIWPAPSSIPSVQKLMSERLSRSVYAAPLWGEGCAEEGPWGPLWRDRNVRHGYYLAAFAPSGRVCVALMSRGPSSPAFTASDIARGEATARLVARAVDACPVTALPCDTLVTEVPLAFSVDGTLGTVGVGGPELLRDLGGGGSDATARGREIVERAAARFRDAILTESGEAQHRFPDVPRTIGGPEEEAAFRQGNFKLMLDARTRIPRTIELAQHEQGLFELKVAASNSMATGGMQVLGTLRRRVPRLLTVVRGLVELAAPGREIELAMQLCTGASLPDAAHVLGISPTSAKTLVSRLATRVGTTGQERVVDALAQVGSAVLR